VIAGDHRQRVGSLRREPNQPLAWDGPAADPTCLISARVISNLEITLLDRRFTLRTARWPAIHGAVMQRLLARSRMLSMQSAINSLPGSRSG
jgi:hypothetical protein